MAEKVGISHDFEPATISLKPFKEPLYPINAHYIRCIGVSIIKGAPIP